MRDPVLAGILSLIVPGVGHLYNGQFLAGALWLMALVTIIPGFWIGTGGILGLPRADRVLGQGNARPPHRLGDEQPPPLRARAAQGRPRLRRLRAGRLGRRSTLQRRAVAATGRAVAPLQPPPRPYPRGKGRRGKRVKGEGAKREDKKTACLSSSTEDERHAVFSSQPR